MATPIQVPGARAEGHVAKIASLFGTGAQMGRQAQGDSLIEKRVHGYGVKLARKAKRVEMAAQKAATAAAVAHAEAARPKVDRSPVTVAANTKSGLEVAFVPAGFQVPPRGGSAPRTAPPNAMAAPMPALTQRHAAPLTPPNSGVWIKKIGKAHKKAHAVSVEDEFPPLPRSRDVRPPHEQKKAKAETEEATAAAVMERLVQSLVTQPSRVPQDQSRDIKNLKSTNTTSTSSTLDTEPASVTTPAHANAGEVRVDDRVDDGTASPLACASPPPYELPAATAFAQDEGANNKIKIASHDASETLSEDEGSAASSDASSDDEGAAASPMRGVARIEEVQEKSNLRKPNSNQFRSHETPKELDKALASVEMLTQANATLKTENASLSAKLAEMKEAIVALTLQALKKGI